jgi:formylmethanofuran dehydrogenase subunit E
MIKRESAAPADAAVNAHHRALRRCHGCGNYARPAAEASEGRLLCEKCFGKARRAGEDVVELTIAEA